MNNPQKIIINSIGCLFFIFIGVFAYNRFKPYHQGAQILHSSLDTFQTIDTGWTTLSGVTKNVKYMNINGRSVSINEDLSFSETIVVAPGSNTINLVTYDTFEREKVYTYYIYSTLETPEHHPTLVDALESSQDTLEITADEPSDVHSAE